MPDITSCWKLVVELVDAKAASIGYLDGFSYPFGVIGKELGDLLGRAKMGFGIRKKPGGCLIQGRVLSHAGQDIRQRFARRVVEQRTSGSHDSQSVKRGQLQGETMLAACVGKTMSVYGEAESVGSEQVCHSCRKVFIERIGKQSEQTLVVGRDVLDP